MKTIKKIISIILSIIFILSFSLNQVVAKNYKIKDVSADDANYETIQKILNQGWMSLTLSNFYPKKFVTRGEFALILAKYNSELSVAKNVKKSSFKDVKVSDTYSKYIELEKKYMTYFKAKDGYYFKPKEYITREDALAAIVKIKGFDMDSAAADGSESEVALDEIIEDAHKVSSSIKENITIGVVNELIDLETKDDKTYLHPKKSITRLDLALLLDNASDKKDYTKVDESTDDRTEDSSSNSKSDDTNKGNDPKPNVPIQNPNIINGLGYLSIDINGRSKTFNQSEILKKDVYKQWKLVLKNPSDKDYFEILLPENIASGEKYVLDSNDPDKTYLSEVRVKYFNLKGIGYTFGIATGQHFSSKITISINKWDTINGYASGTINGEIKLSKDETVSFDNGKFELKVETSGF